MQGFVLKVQSESIPKTKPKNQEAYEFCKQLHSLTIVENTKKGNYSHQLKSLLKISLTK